MDNPAKPPIIIYKPGRWDKLKSGLDPADQEIVDRLRKLKDHDKQPAAPTTEDIRRRLALLKDLDPDYIPPANVCVLIYINYLNILLTKLFCY